MLYRLRLGNKHFKIKTSNTSKAHAPIRLSSFLRPYREMVRHVPPPVHEENGLLRKAPTVQQNPYL